MSHFRLATPGLAPVFILLLLVCSAIPTEGKRRDSVVMKNGDKLSGEVKKLENGLLYLDADYVSGAIELDWLQVEKVQSRAVYQIVLKNGDHMAGTIEKIPSQEAQAKDFEVRSADRSILVAAQDVVNIEYLKPNFWR